MNTNGRSADWASKVDPGVAKTGTLIDAFVSPLTIFNLSYIRIKLLYITR